MDQRIIDNDAFALESLVPSDFNTCGDFNIKSEV